MNWVAALVGRRLFFSVQMNLRGVFIFAVGGFVSTVPLAAADAAKVDYTQRNEPFAPAAGVPPEKRSPEHNRTVQDLRVAPSVTNPAGSVPSERRSPIDLTEAREKRVLAPETQKPAVRAPELSPFDHRESRFKTAGSTEKPKLVTRYQDAMTSAHATTQKRSPALGADTTARVNRFVFRRSGAAPADGAVPVGSTPAAARPQPRALP
jgi:hypothetical protein